VKLWKLDEINSIFYDIHLNSFMRKASSATPGNTVLSLRSPYAAG